MTLLSPGGYLTEDSSRSAVKHGSHLISHSSQNKVLTVKGKMYV